MEWEWFQGLQGEEAWMVCMLGMGLSCNHCLMFFSAVVRGLWHCLKARSKFLWLWW